MEVRERATPALVVGRFTPIAEVAQRMAETGARAAVVVDNGELWGVVSDRDLVVRGLARRHTPESPVNTVATLEPAWIAAGDPVEDGYRLLRERGLRQVPVLEDGTVVGLLRLDDLVPAIPVADLMPRPEPARPPGPFCPGCGGDRFEVVAPLDGSEGQLLCRDCARCWAYQAGTLVQVDPYQCPGCPQRRVCFGPLISPAGAAWALPCG